VRPGCTDRALIALLIVPSALVLSACGGAATPTDTQTSVTSAVSRPSVGETRASPSTSVSAFDRTATPATSSGPLGPSTMPSAAALGAGWTANTGAGGAEDGYAGNGTPVVARDVNDVIDGMLPFGCPAATYAARLPTPLHALEADYRHTTGRLAVGTALDYGTPDAAAIFVRAYEKALMACQPGSGATTVVTVKLPPAPGSFVTVQTDEREGTVYLELLVSSGRIVRLLDIEGATTPVAPWGTLAAALTQG